MTPCNKSMRHKDPGKSLVFISWLRSADTDQGYIKDTTIIWQKSASTDANSPAASCIHFVVSQNACTCTGLTFPTTVLLFKLYPLYHSVFNLCLFSLLYTDRKSVLFMITRFNPHVPVCWFEVQDEYIASVSMTVCPLKQLLYFHSSK